MNREKLAAMSPRKFLALLITFFLLCSFMAFLLSLVRLLDFRIYAHFMIGYLIVGVFVASLFHLDLFRLRDKNGKVETDVAVLGIVMLSWPALAFVKVNWLDRDDW